MKADTNTENHLAMDVLQQFRVIYGAMRQHFREIEDRCGLSGSQTWVLQEALSTPGIGVSELAARMGIHQSTCSQLVEKLVGQGYLTKSKLPVDQRRVGLCLTQEGQAAIDSLPGSAQGLLPEALAALPEGATRTLQIHLSELIQRLPGKNDAFAKVPLAHIVTPLPSTED